MDVDLIDECCCPPIVIFGFSRPRCLQLVFDKVREAKPRKLFLILDFPREGRDDDVVGWKECKKIFEGVDWDCEVHRNYAIHNMGCRDRIESGISWAFEYVDRLVILEDDCVPDFTFFRFCGELLERYKNDMRVGMIAGCDEHFHVKDIDFHGDSYYFDRYPSIWGWATWKRAWDLHDPKMLYWPEFRKSFDLLNGYFRNKGATRRRKEYTELLYRRKAGTWDGVWVTTMYKENWLCVHPTVNLISNYGCNISSRIDKGERKWWHRKIKNPWDRRPTESIKFPLKHPVSMLPHIISENWRFIDSGVVPSVWRKVLGFAKKSLKCLVKG